MIYNIQNLDNLEDKASDLATKRQKLAENVNRLNAIVKSIRTNWQNDAGADLNAILAELEKNITLIREAIDPAIGRYVKAMNTLVAASKSAQSKTM